MPQGAVRISEAMGIPVQGSSPQSMPMQTGVPLGGQRSHPAGVSFGNRHWSNPPPGMSYGRSVMGASPYGKSVDMVDVVAQLMDGELHTSTCWKGPTLTTDCDLTM